MHRTNQVQYDLRMAVMTMSFAVCFSSCVTYRVQTNKQEASEYQHQKVKSILWGILQSPQTVYTPICDSLRSHGMSEVYIRRNFGDFILSAVTIGIYNPATLYWKCGKPCPLTGNM